MVDAEFVEGVRIIDGDIGDRQVVGDQHLEHVEPDIAGLSDCIQLSCHLAAFRERRLDERSVDLFEVYLDESVIPAVVLDRNPLFFSNGRPITLVVREAPS